MLVLYIHHSKEPQTPADDGEIFYSTMVQRQPQLIQVNIVYNHFFFVFGCENILKAELMIHIF